MRASWWCLLPAMAGTVEAGAQSVELPLFVGQRACIECHADGASASPCSEPTVPRHATALEALSRAPARHIAALNGVPSSPRETRLCLECHSTGADEGPRWWSSGFDPQDGVQCESCHGPGSGHVERPHASHTVRRSGRTACLACHTDRPSHREVLDGGFALSPADDGYKTPVNLAVSADGARVYVACEHSDSVMVLNSESGAVVAEIPVGRRPSAVTLSSHGDRLYVSNRLGGTVSVIDTDALRVIGEIRVGAEPHGLAVNGGGTRLFVANTGGDSVSVVDTGTSTEVRRLVAGVGPWSMARSADNRWAYLTSVRPNASPFRQSHSSELSVIDLDRGVIDRRHQVPDANMLGGIAVVPDLNIVLFTLMRTKNLVPTTRLAQGWTVTGGLGVLWPDGRVDQVLLDRPDDYFPDPMDIAVSPDGRHAVVSSGGADLVAVIDVPRLLATVAELSPGERSEILPNHLGMSDRFVVKRIAVGANPRGVAFSPDGRFVYVAAALEDAVVVIEADSWTVAKRMTLGGPGQISRIRFGERLFHSAKITYGRQFSCRSCHPDGHVNGLTSDIEADGIGMNPVDNRTLRGILDTAPFKWEGTNPTLHRQCGPRLAVFFTRLTPYSPDELEALVKYMCTIESPPNPFRDPAGLSPAQRRGKLVFERTASNDGTPLEPQQRCVDCHNSAHRTNRSRVDVATSMWFDAPIADPPMNILDADEFGELGTYYFIDAGLEQKRFDVPHLRNLYDEAPYLHNGGAATLEEIWTRFNMVNRHGATGDLTRQQFNDLIAYLRAL